MEWFLLLGVVFFGACMGSFINVVAYRVPREESVVKPRSACPACGHTLNAIDLIPILGWFFLKGRCRYCEEKISFRYPLIETICALGTLAIVLRFYSPVDFFTQIYGILPDGSLPLQTFYFNKYIQMFSALWLFYIGMALALIDLEYTILPNTLTISGTLVGLFLGIFNPQVLWYNSLLGALGGGGGLLLIAWIYQKLRGIEDPVGMGDIKYLLLIGATLGIEGVIYTLAVSAFLGAFWGIIQSLMRGQGLKNKLPFGPFLAIGSVIVCLWINEIQQFIYPMK